MSRLENYFLDRFHVRNSFPSVLKEEIYRRPETALIDAEFKKILDWFYNEDNIYKVKKNKFDVDTYFKKELNNIEDLIKKLLNATIMLKFDRASSFDRLSFGMCIFPSNQEMHNKIRKEIENPKKGFYLYECTNSTVFMDFALIKILVKNKLDSRFLTAVLLHELGHKIYVKKQDDIYRYGSTKDVLTDGAKKNKKIVKGVTTVSYLVCLGGMVLASISEGKNKLQVVSAITAVVSAMLSFSSSIMLSAYGQNAQYVESESLSDLVAVKYGYGYEIAKTMDIFYAMSKIKIERQCKLLSWFKKNTNELNTSKMRREQVKKALELELKDSSNSEVEKKKIKAILDAIKDMEVKNEECNPFEPICETCSNLLEALTFRSADMKKINSMLYHSKFLNKVEKLLKKGWTIVHHQEDLSPLNLKVVENKIREMAEVSVTNTADVDVEVTKRVEVGGKRSKTHLQLRNIVLMEVGNYLCIVEGLDNGRVISVTAIFLNEGQQLKFVKIQSSIFKF